MSDTPQGPDWWQASDDKWYPPPRPEMPGDEAIPQPAAAAGFPPPGGAPAGPPLGPPVGGFPPGGFPPAGPPSGGFPAGVPNGGFPPGAPSGPYGAPPPGQGGQNRTPLFVAIGVVAAALLIGLFFIMQDDGDDTTTGNPGTNTTDATTPDTEPPATFEPSDDTEPDTNPSGNTELEVVESGFSNYMGGFDQDELKASYGFIVENKGDETATDVDISVSIYDEAGAVLSSEQHTIYVIRPGEKFGVGDEIYSGLTARVGKIEVQIGEPSPYATEVPDEGGLTAEGVSTAAEEYGGLTTTFTVKSTYAQQLDSPYAYAIFRNANGAIVGGAWQILNFVPANGSTAGEISSFDQIPDVATTEVYVDPGYLG
ncbi:MAG TPA: hypothetical protein VFI47_08075 [Acidimicrobiales bacterium]|nr:hypothetical protein [Acidimicrobiales bacterium]